MGGLFGGGQTISTSAPRIGAMQIQTSSFGQVIALLYGKNRIPANMMWYGDFTAIPHTTSQTAGGKGGSVTSSNTTFTYTTGVAMGLCEGPILGIGDIWTGKQKVSSSNPQTNETYTVPSSKLITVNQTAVFNSDISVTTETTASNNYAPYAGIGGAAANITFLGIGATNAGPTGYGLSAIGGTVNNTVITRLTRVTGTPAAGQYSVSASGQYSFNAAEIGKTVHITYFYSQSPAQTIGMQVFLGTYPQSPWSYLQSTHPDQAINYPGIAYVANGAYDLGDNAQLPNHTFEVIGRIPYNYGIIDDANPADIIVDFCTNSNYGCGLSSTLFYNSAQLYKDYCTANGIFMSPAYTEQKAAQEVIGDILNLTNTALVWSEGYIKLVPYGDFTVTGNGVTYSPTVYPIYEVTDSDLIDTGDDPILVTRKTQADAYNKVQVEYLNRSNQYNVEIVECPDQVNIEIYGVRPLPPVQAHGITDPSVARLVGQNILQRNLYIRNRYEFHLGWRFCILEPMDIILLNDAALGLSHTPVRIIEISEDEWGELTFVVEDIPDQVSQAVVYSVSSAEGYQIDFNASPGNVVTPKIFEAAPDLTSTGLQLGIAVTGQSDLWSGCDVYVSNDGTNYALLGTVTSGARYGKTTNSITSATGQGVTVQLAGNGGQILTGSTQDSSNDTTGCLIGNEFVSYTTASLVATNKYTLTLAGRGKHTTSPVAHALNEDFVRIDTSILYSDPLDTSMIGKTLYFKFLSFNKYNAGNQLLSDVNPYTYTITGVMALIPPSSVTSLTVQGGVATWPTVPDTDVLGYRMKFQYGINSDWGTASLLHNGQLTNSPYSMEIIPNGVATIMVKAVDASGVESQTSAQVIVDFGVPITANIVSSYDYKANAFPGTYTGATIVSGNLLASSTNPFFSSGSSAFFGLPNANFYTTNSSALNWVSSTYNPPLMGIGGNLTVAFNIDGAAINVQYRSVGANSFYGNSAALFYGSGSSPFFGSNYYGDWSQWVGSLTLKTYCGYQWQVSCTAGSPAGKISNFVAQVDLPTRVLNLSNVAIGPSGTRVSTAAGYFNSILNIQGTVISGGSAVISTIVDKDAVLGPLIKLNDISGNPVSGNVDLIIQGY